MRTKHEAVRGALFGRTTDEKKGPTPIPLICPQFPFFAGISRRVEVLCPDVGMCAFVMYATKKTLRCDIPS